MSFKDSLYFVSRCDVCQFDLVTRVMSFWRNEMYYFRQALEHLYPRVIEVYDFSYNFRSFFMCNLIFIFNTTRVIFFCSSQCLTRFCLQGTSG